MEGDDDGGEVGATIRSDSAGRAATPDPSTQGETLGRYELLDRLGAGAMGVVWAALDTRLDRRVAIKLVHPRLARSREAIERLLREARAMAKVQHPAVVTVHDSGDLDGHVYIVMELVAGTTLGAELRARTVAERAAWPKWLAVMVTAGRGLAEAHRAGVLHRDFKPDNVLLDHRGHVRVADFGLASLGAATEQASDDAVDLELTAAGSLLGTPAYMSPEQLQGQPADTRSDQFAFCVAAWEALYGQRPFVVAERGLAAIPALLERIEQRSFEVPPSPVIPTRVREILERGLATAPDARWPSIDVLLDELERAARPPRRRRIVVAGVVLAAAAIGAVPAVLVASEPAAVSDSVLEPTHLFPLEGRDRFALLPDARRVAIAGTSLRIRALSDGAITPGPSLPDDTIHVEADEEEVWVGTTVEIPLGRWRPRATTVERSKLTGRWLGTTTSGELMQSLEGIVHVVGPQGEVAHWRAPKMIDVSAVSPDGTRVAWLEAAPGFDVIVVRDVRSGSITRSRPLRGAVALTWRDDRALLFAEGTSGKAALREVAWSPEGFGVERTWLERPGTWIGQISAGAGVVVFSDLRPAARAKRIPRGPNATGGGDLGRVVNVTLGFAPDGALLTWGADRRIVDRVVDGVVRPTRVVLEREPANATVAGDLLIVALRGDSGRAIVAFSLASGALRWSRPEGVLHAVRCAGDLQPPCVAIVARAGRRDVMRIDPTTGRLEDTILVRDIGEDVALHADGRQLLVALSGSPLAPAVLRVHDLETGGAKEIGLRRLGRPRSVAFDPRGGVIASGSTGRNTSSVQHIGPEFRELYSGEDALLMLVRASPADEHVYVVARTYEPELWRLDLP